MNGSLDNFNLQLAENGQQRAPPINHRAVFMTLPKISDRNIAKKTPSQIFNRVLNMSEAVAQRF